MSHWCSLYLHYGDADATHAVEALTTRLRDAISAAGYTLYNPFGLMPGKSYPDTLKTFIFPPREGWIRVLAAPEGCARLTEIISSLAGTPFDVILSLAVDESVNTADQTVALIDVYLNGVKADTEQALSAYLRDGKTLEDFQDALYRPIKAAPPEAQPNIITQVSADMAGQVGDLAGQINPKQANALVSRLSENLLGKVGGSKDEANQLLNQAKFSWQSEGGRRINAVMGCLTLENWRTPDFVELRDAYQLHARLKRNPNLPSYPGDAEAMALVPNALDYTPIFGGKT